MFRVHPHGDDFRPRWYATSRVEIDLFFVAIPGPVGGWAVRCRERRLVVTVRPVQRLWAAVPIWVTPSRRLLFAWLR